MSNQVLEAILHRRSVRKYTDEGVPEEVLSLILEAGRWAPSGLNNQPWRFAIVKSPEIKKKIAGLTHYTKVVEGASVLVAVFMDHEAGYHTIKDAQAIGACLQNMLLAIHSLGLGGVWLGEILKSAEEVRNVLGLEKNLELHAVLAIGHPESTNQTSSRRPLDELILARY